MGEQRREPGRAATRERKSREPSSCEPEQSREKRAEQQPRRAEQSRTGQMREPMFYAHLSTCQSQCMCASEVAGVVAVLHVALVVIMSDR